MSRRAELLSLDAEAAAADGSLARLVSRRSGQTWSYSIMRATVRHGVRRAWTTPGACEVARCRSCATHQLVADRHDTGHRPTVSWLCTFHALGASRLLRVVIRETGL